MRTTKKLFNVYTLEELKNIDNKKYEREIENIKEEIIYDNFCFLDEDFACMLKEYFGIEAEKICYSLGYQQGDGVCFTMNSVLDYIHLKNKKDLNAFEKYIIENYSKDELEDILEYLNSGYNFKIVKHSSHYEHCYTCNFDYEYFYPSDDEKLCDRINKTTEKLCDDLFKNVYVDICSKLEKHGYSCYDVSDQNAIEYAKENELEYEVFSNYED